MTTPLPTARERFLAKVDGRCAEPVCSPQIGGGAGFDTRLAGKEWISETTLADTLAAVERFDMLPLILVDAGDLLEDVEGMGWEIVEQRQGQNRREACWRLDTPAGQLERYVIEQPHESAYSTRYPVQSAADLPVLEHVLDVLISCRFSTLTERVRQAVRSLAGRAATCVQWPAQPYELLCWPDTMTTTLLALDEPKWFRRLMDKILQLDERLIHAVAEAGADFLFLGGPGAEMISPDYYRQFIVPGSREVSAMAHRADLRVYTHICSPIEPMLSMGFYNQMGIDLFETLSPPPVGNVADLREALQQLDEGICTRGNLGLDILLNADPDTVRTSARAILDATRGRNHILAASDYLFYDTPEENVHALCVCAAE